MPNYKQKITKLLQYKDFLAHANQEPDRLKRAFLEVLYWSARRLTEVMQISQEDLYPTQDTIFINFWHVKKPKNYQVNQELPRNQYLEIILSQEGRIFPYTNKWGYRVVKTIFPQLYPHYFRLNMRNIVGDKFGDAQGRSLLDITPHADQAYAVLADLRKVYMWQRDKAKHYWLR